MLGDESDERGTVAAHLRVRVVNVKHFFDVNRRHGCVAVEGKATARVSLDPLAE